MTSSLAGQRIGVLGLARSGLAAARLALARGAAVYASDSGDGERVRRAAEEIRKAGGEADTGGHDVEKLSACDRVVVSPGIPHDIPVLQEAGVGRERLLSEVDLALEQLDVPLAAVTGTNGKTTVTALLAHLLDRAGMDAPAAGNIGTPLCEVALRERAPDAVALEISSFQLGLTDRLTPTVGVLTNLAPDHLDRYGTVEAYYADKQRLFRNAGPGSVWVVNGEDDAVSAMTEGVPGRRFLFRVQSLPAEGERGGWLSGDELRLRLDGAEERLVDRGELLILGVHNAANALAAAVTARLLGADLASVREGLRSFGAPPHRLEVVAERDGVRWINDSKATNLASARVAVQSMDRPTVLLMGGHHKGEPYAELIPDLRTRVRAVVAFGEAAAEIDAAIQGAVSLERVGGGLAAAVARAAELAAPGDAILLAPACSSYDEFENFEHRGEAFTRLARGEA
jgi:UDP-N-acetylmuramoylalanine--D-glutamate ligase